MVTYPAIAEVAHETNRAYCQSMGDGSQLPWAEAPDWQRDSALNGVIAIASGTISRAEQSHESWLREKEATGWVHGPVKDPLRKTHPCMVPFHELPPEQRAKDHIFFALVSTLLRL